MKKLLNPVIITLLFFIFVQLFSLILLFMLARTKNNVLMENKDNQNNSNIDVNIADISVQRQEINNDR